MMEASQRCIISLEAADVLLKALNDRGITRLDREPDSSRCDEAPRCYQGLCEVTV